MKTAVTLVLAVTLLIGVSYGMRGDAPEEKGQSSEPPIVGIHMAALQGDIDAVRRHVTAGTDLDARDPFGSTPLIIAITFDQPDVAKFLIEGGADVEIRDDFGSTPLLIAAFLGRTEIVRTLLRSGADRYARNNDGATAFDMVTTPFDDLRDIYDQIGTGLAPLGLELDLEQIEANRPKIAEMLRPKPEELEGVEYTPLTREDWQISTPAEQGLDPELVAELYLEAAESETIYGVLVVKNGYLVAEGYFNGGSVEQEARLQSVTKSYTSALAGIALEQGCLSSVDRKMLDFFPELAGKVTDPRKKEITIRHLLQMRAGYPWEETDPALWDGLLSGHYPPIIEEFPLIADPGAEFNYSNLSSNWLGIIIARACGTDLKSYAEKHLFLPLDAKMGDWGMDRDGHNNGCGDLHATARDAAKFGLLYLNGGEYGGNQVLPASWIRESLEDYSEDAWVAQPRQHKAGLYFRDLGYGYQWWSARVGQRQFNFAWGHGGQLVVLLHDLDMIIVVTSAPFYLEHDDEAWRHEQANINLVGKFIASLPKREPSKGQ